MACAAGAALAGREGGLMLQCGIISAGAVAYVVLLVAIEGRLRPAGDATPPRPR
jgi:hypothetical protein